MKHKKAPFAAAGLAALLFAATATANILWSPQDRDILMQVSVIDALLAGNYDGLLPTGELLRYGDFGIGTFDALDGEMMILDGTVYAIRHDGSVEQVDPAETTPFAVATFLDADIVLPLENIDFEGVQRKLEEILDNPNIFCAVRVDGVFATMKTRSVPRQTPPYPPLAEVAKKQNIFDFEQVEGTLAGFWSPPFVKGVNVPGWHFHFLTADRSGGGHVLAFDLLKGVARLDITPRFKLLLPETGMHGDLSADRAAELHKIESDPAAISR